MATLPHSLDPIFHPRSVAVVGASATAGTVGNILIRNLIENPFGGIVYPVNPNHQAVHGVLCYPHLAAIAEPVDLAVIATPAGTVPGIIKQCVKRGIPAAIILSAGFSERGAEGRKLEAEIKALAKGHLRIIGPNCLGVLHPPSNLNASFAASMARPGRIALLSQSGAICTAILDWAREKHIGFSSFVSVGAMIDVDFADLIDYFADDGPTRSIILYVESIGDVRKFLSAARGISRTKQVIVVKAGRHEAGARAAASHTGALAGADDVFDTAFRRAGVLRVLTIPELFSMSEILSMQSPPRGPALAIITNAGGPGVMATDALMLDGGHLAELGPATKAALDAVLPPFWSHANPIDILGDATPERYRRVVEICAKDDRMDGLLVLLTPQAMTDPTETARQLASLGPLQRKPILACFMGGSAVRAGRDILDAASIPTFYAPELAIRAFLHMVQYRRNQELLYETPQAITEETRPDEKRIRSIFKVAQGQGRTLLTEAESKQVLSAYGIPVTPTVSCASVDEAVASADCLGYPAVLKLRSRTITHKSDVGGVQLNLVNEEAVRQAFKAIRSSVAAAGHGESFEGVTVQPMVKDKGCELILGSSVDAQFGPVILFGAGGVLVEVFKDRALGLPPLTRTLARRLMERTKIYQALQGVRGQRSVDMEELETLLVRFAQFVVDFPEVREIDINPLLASPERLVVLDARVVLGPADKRPPLAIEPYPSRYTAPFRLRDGREVLVRTIRPEDEPLIIAFHAGLSAHTIRMRFFSMVKTLSRDSLIRLCHLDYTRELALVAIWREEDGEHFAGVSRYYLHPESATAEFALIVGDTWQRQGLGRHLMGRLMAVARERGVRRLKGLVLRENDAMLTLMKGLHFKPEDSPDPDIVVVSKDLVP
jgi:acetyltransferase